MSVNIVYFKTKALARKEIIARGFTEQRETSSSGDYAFGSRIYFAKPATGLGLNDAIGNISKVAGQWACCTPED